jgi:hypothetical protein
MPSTNVQTDRVFIPGMRQRIPAWAQARAVRRRCYRNDGANAVIELTQENCWTEDPFADLDVQPAFRGWWDETLRG